MHIRRPILSLSTLIILAALTVSTNAGEKAGSTSKRLKLPECEQLVKELVYPGEPPFRERYVSLGKLDLRAIRVKQAKVKAAYDKLSDNIDVALSILVKHTDDKRLSYVYEEVGTSAVIAKASVGFACYQIVKAHVEVYRPAVTKPDFAFIPRCPSFISSCGGIDKWWEQRKDKTLAALQLEGIEWAMRLKKPKLFESNEEWDEAKRALKKMAEGIRTSHKPVVVKHHVRFFAK